jgi:hypothetical protein
MVSHCSFWHPPAANISAKGTTAIHCDIMWYDREYLACHIGEISVHWVRFVMLTPAVGYIQYPKCTANIHWVVVVVIEIWIYLPPGLWYFRWWIYIEPGDGQLACRAMTSFWYCLSHIARCQVFIIIAGQILWITVWLPESWRRCRGDDIATPKAFMFNYRHPSMFGTVFILHILEKGLLELDSVGCLILRIHIHSLVLCPKCS